MYKMVRWTTQRHVFSLSATSHLQPRESAIPVETHSHNVITQITLVNLDRFDSCILFTSSFRAPEICSISRTLNQFLQLDTNHRSNNKCTSKIYSVISLQPMSSYPVFDGNFLTTLFFNYRENNF